LKILAISAFGFVCVLSLFCCALSPLFAVTALVMANHDLSEMAKGRMDRSGEGTTRAGKVMAIIQLAIVAAFFALYGASLLLRK
jgi:hypothetical protein